MARLLPGLLVKRPDLPRPAPLSESGQRLRLFKALTQAILGSSDPLLLVLDDAHWCDAETLEWLHYLLRSDSHRPFLVVVAARTEELDRDHPLQALRLALGRTGQTVHVELIPLTQAGTGELAAHVAGRTLATNQIEHIFAETEGNPLFVVEMVRAGLPLDTPVSTARDDGLPLHGNGEKIYTDGTDSQQHSRPPIGHVLPPKIFAIIDARLAQLSPAAHELAEISATIGRSFAVAVLEHAQPDDLQRDEEAFVRALDELWRRRIIREQGTNTYDFSHDKIRQVVCTKISQARQQLLHRRVARALEAFYAADLEPVSGQIATHFEQGGLWELAAAYYQRAAERARRVYANREAKALYTHAVACTARIMHAPDKAAYVPLYIGRALVCRSLAQLEDAITDWQQVRQIAHAAGDVLTEGESLCQLAYTHWLTFSDAQITSVEKYAQAAIVCADQAGTEVMAHRVMARALTMLGAVDQVHRELAQAEHKFQSALQLSRQTGDKEASVQTLGFLCLQTYLQGDFQNTLQTGHEGVTLAREIQEEFDELHSLAFLCQAQWSLGHFAQAFALQREAMTLAQERGNLWMQGRLLNTLGWFYYECGDYAAALIHDQESVEVGRTSGIDNVEISALINLGYDCLAVGETDRGLAYFESTAERVQKYGFGAHKWRWLMKLFIGLAEHAYITGAYQQALDYVNASLVEARASNARKYQARGQTLRGQILAQLGNERAASAELRTALALATQLQSPTLFYPIAFALGQLCESAGHTDEADKLFAQARIAVEKMATALEIKSVGATFLQSPPVQTILSR